MKNQIKQETNLPWEKLDTDEKMRYIIEAEYLISKGYLVGNPFDLARTIYEKRNRKNDD